jgi:hypothetical protein
MKAASRPSLELSGGVTFGSATPAAISEAPPPSASLRQVVGAVLWSFFGVRKCKAMLRDVTTIKPAQLIVVATLCAASFVFTLLVICRLIARGL